MGFDENFVRVKFLVSENFGSEQKLGRGGDENFGPGQKFWGWVKILVGAKIFGQGENFGWGAEILVQDENFGWRRKEAAAFQL